MHTWTSAQTCVHLFALKQLLNTSVADIIVIYRVTSGGIFPPLSSPVEGASAPLCRFLFLTVFLFVKRKWDKFSGILI